MPEKIMTQQTYPLVEVRLKVKPAYTMKIRASSFDPAIHEKVVARARLVVQSQPKVLLSDLPEEKLKTLTMAKLRELPEYDLIDSPIAKKDDLVAQILEVREKHSKD